MLHVTRCTMLPLGPMSHGECSMLHCMSTRACRRILHADGSHSRDTLSVRVVPAADGAAAATAPVRHGTASGR